MTIMDKIWSRPRPLNISQFYAEKHEKVVRTSSGKLNGRRQQYVVIAIFFSDSLFINRRNNSKRYQSNSLKKVLIVH